MQISTESSVHCLGQPLRAQLLGYVYFGDAVCSLYVSTTILHVLAVCGRKLGSPRERKNKTNELWGNLLLKKLNNSYAAFVIIALLPLFWVLSLLPVLPLFGESFTEEAE